MTDYRLQIERKRLLLASNAGDDAIQTHLAIFGFFSGLLRQQQKMPALDFAAGSQRRGVFF